MTSKIEIAEPSAHYKPYIQYYKYIESDFTGILKIIPNNSVELYFNYTRITLFSEPNYDLDNPQIHLTGYHAYQQTSFSHMHGTGRNGGFAIVFKPQGFYDLFKIKCTDFAKYAINGESIFKMDMYHLWEILRPHWNVQDMKQIVEKHLTPYAERADGGFHLINHIVQYMDKKDGMIPVSQLYNKFNTTPRSLERHFKEEIGLSPKEILQVFRINKAISMLMENPDCDLTHIGYMSGFYDQSHFIREIRRITGVLPGELQSKKSVEGVPIHNLLFIRKN